MINLSTLYTPQTGAVTGKKPRISLADVLFAQSPAYRSSVERKQDIDLEKESLKQEKEISDKEMALAREQTGELKKQAKISTGINLATLGMGGAYLYQKSRPAAPATKTSLATVSAEGGGSAAPVSGAAPAGEGGATTGGASPYLKGAGVMGLEYGGQKYGQPLASKMHERYGGDEATWKGTELVARRTGQGAIIGGPWGAAAGAGVGLVEAFATEGEGCIIITAATSPDSYEVQVAREYRDWFLSPSTLRGYYTIAERIVPLMRRYRIIKRLIKRHLVDNLITFARWQLGIWGLDEVMPRPSNTAICITNAFLFLCDIVGMRKRSYMRCNGEAV